MRFLIAIKSCEYDRRRDAHQLIRATWGRDTGETDLRFFLGGGLGIAEDETIVLAPDDYLGLPWKTREIVRWAVRDDYDWAFLCDTGSFVIPHHLMSCGFEKYDYSGYWCMKMETFRYSVPGIEVPVCYPWASGGGYILSRKAMEIVASTPPTVRAEDLYVGQALAARGVLLHDLAPDGYKGYVVDWIHDEVNTVPIHDRAIWMQAKYEDAKARCAETKCNWQRPCTLLRDDPLGTRAQHEQILAERQAQRARLKK